MANLDRYSKEEIEDIRKEQGSYGREVSYESHSKLKKQCLAKGDTWKGGKIPECIPKSEVRTGKKKHPSKRSR